MASYVQLLTSLPPGPKLSTIPSTQPDTYSAHDMMLARKNKNPILPPNSGPNARLIITEQIVKENM